MPLLTTTATKSRNARRLSLLAFAPLLLAPLRGTKAQGTFVGRWSIEYPLNLRVVDGVESSTGTGRARLTLTQRGDSVIGTWEVLAPVTIPMPPKRTLRGVAVGGRLQLQAEPTTAIIASVRDTHTLTIITRYDLRVKGDTLVGTEIRTPNDPAFPAASRPFVAIRDRIPEGITTLPPRGAPPTDERFSTFDSHGVPVHYVESGSGDPVVLIHGFSADLEMWNPVRYELSKQFHVIAIDCRGHGESGKPHEPSAYGIEMVNDVVRLLDHLGISKAHIVGYSMGGSIALKMLQTHPDRMLSVVSGGSWGFRATDERWDSTLVKNLLAGVPLDRAMGVGVPGTPTMSTEPEAPVTPVTIQGLRGVGAARSVGPQQDSRALGAQRAGNVGLYVDYSQFKRNRVPALVIHGANDNPTMYTEIEHTLANAEFMVVQGTGHGSTPESPEFIADLRDFLARHSSTKR